jgi:hypothetical protein
MEQCGQRETGIGGFLQKKSRQVAPEYQKKRAASADLANSGRGRYRITSYDQSKETETMLTTLAPLAWSAEALAPLEHHDVWIVERTPPRVTDLRELAVGDYRAEVRERDALAHAQLAVTRLHLNSELADDIAVLIRSFVRQFGLDRANLRVEVVNKTSCPKFHCDTLHVRMITTYRGPTTQYIEREAPETIHDAPLGSLVFLKGHRHPTFADRVHHRSPPMPEGAKRLCVVLDY